MPTFKNNTNKPIVYETNGKDILIIDPNEIKEIEYWIPYQQLGLELLSASYPPVPNQILINGTFKFMGGMSRKFENEPCEKYALCVEVYGEAVTLTLGGSQNAFQVKAEYKDVFSWEYVPYITIHSPSGVSTVTVYARKER